MDKSVEDFLRYLSVEKGFSGNTTAAYRNDLQQLTAFVEDKKAFRHGWAGVDRNTLLSYLLSLRERSYSAATLARKTAATKSFFTFLTSDGIIPSNPTENIGSPKVGRALPKALSVEDVDELLEQPAKHTTPGGKRDQAMLELLYATGMRASELISLNLEDVNLGAGYARCLGKGSKERIIPIHQNAVTAINGYLKEGRPKLASSLSGHALFLNQRGGRLTRQGLWLILKAYAKEAGITAEVTPHIIRHSFATHLLREAAPVRHVQELLGHANIASTQVYTHLSSEHLRKEYDKAHPRAKK